MVPRTMNEALLRQFETFRAALERLGGQIQRQLEALLRAEGIPVQFVTLRVKTAESLAQKLARPDRSYQGLWDVTDLLGLRAVTYFDDHVARAARLIEEHFTVDLEHSVDHARPAGYRSVHYVCAHPEGPAPAFRFELQLRTALQHAWAEVEHDLGYKVGDAVPEAIRRRFTRVAGLLEIADQEFVSIRKDLTSSREAASATLANSGELPINLLSLEALVQHEALDALDHDVARALDKPVDPRPFFPDYLVSVLRLTGLDTTGSVLRAVERHGSEVEPVLPRYFEFARQGLGFDAQTMPHVQRGYALLFVAHLAVVRGPELGLSKVTRLTKLYHQLEFPQDEARAHRVASGLISTLGG